MSRSSRKAPRKVEAKTSAATSADVQDVTDTAPGQTKKSPKTGIMTFLSVSSDTMNFAIFQQLGIKDLAALDQRCPNIVKGCLRRYCHSMDSHVHRLEFIRSQWFKTPLFRPISTYPEHTLCPLRMVRRRTILQVCYDAFGLVVFTQEAGGTLSVILTDPDLSLASLKIIEFEKGEFEDAMVGFSNTIFLISERVAQPCLGQVYSRLTGKKIYNVPIDATMEDYGFPDGDIHYSIQTQEAPLVTMWALKETEPELVGTYPACCENEFERMLVVDGHIYSLCCGCFNTRKICIGTSELLWELELEPGNDTDYIFFDIVHGVWGIYLSGENTEVRLIYFVDTQTGKLLPFSQDVTNIGHSVIFRITAQDIYICWLSESTQTCKIFDRMTNTHREVTFGRLLLSLFDIRPLGGDAFAIMSRWVRTDSSEPFRIITIQMHGDEHELVHDSSWEKGGILWTLPGNNVFISAVPQKFNENNLELRKISFKEFGRTGDEIEATLLGNNSRE